VSFSKIGPGPVVAGSGSSMIEKGSSFFSSLPDGSIVFSLTHFFHHAHHSLMNISPSGYFYRCPVNFSDVISLAGNSSPATVLTLLHLPAQKGGHCKPAKLTCFFLIKTRIFSKYPIITIFSIGVDALPLEPKNGIVRFPNGARIRSIYA
jgi:hypothetical protein